MIVLAIAALVALGVALPHALALDRVAPATGAAVWLSALALRALVVVFAALYVILYLPTTDVFAAVTHWCWHTILPVIATHLGLDGHRFGDAATLIPAVALAASVLSVIFGLVRAAAAVRRLLARRTVGTGPRGSIVLGSGEVLLAAAGIARPRIVVSAGALVALDDDELAAGLDHECAHIDRHHHAVLLSSEILRAIARFLPGTRRAVTELRYHLERDADECALRRAHDPDALASAICKAAGVAGGPALVGLAGGSTVRRVRLLVEGVAGRERRGETAARALAVVLAAVALGLAIALPTAVAAGISLPQSAVRHCVD